MKMMELTSENFESEIKESEMAVVDFYATWCGPCQMQGPVIEQFAEKYPDVLVAKVNIDDQISIAQKYQITSVPTILAFKNGEKTVQAVGYHSIEDLEEIIGV